MSFLIGLLAGTFGGLVGLGGGVIMVPLLAGVLKLAQHKAHGTSLVALVFTGLMGSVTYAMQGNIDILASALLASTAIFTARAGAHFAHALPEWKLKKAFGVFMIVITILLLLKPYLPQVVDPSTGLTWVKILVLLLTGVFTGFLSGMMGVGGGTIMVPSMVLLAGFTQYTAQGSSLLAMVPAGGVGAYTHWRLGNVNTGTLTGLVPGILIGTFLGGSLAHIITEDALRVIFAAVLVWTGFRYLRTPVPKPEKREE
ncbi:sulfite exporter TauE/SafE family protein [Pelotomaculum propionicicum]|uniref:sulfite exporter TauE/SafE family protein n=1 Tax=Pelotomaculum propionicicum TaxID=258475 RepID=UPI003B815FA5